MTSLNPTIQWAISQPSASARFTMNNEKQAETLQDRSVTFSSLLSHAALLTGMGRKLSFALQNQQPVSVSIQDWGTSHLQPNRQNAAGGSWLINTTTVQKLSQDFGIISDTTYLLMLLRNKCYHVLLSDNSSYETAAQLINYLFLFPKTSVGSLPLWTSVWEPDGSIVRTCLTVLPRFNGRGSIWCLSC